MSKSREQLQHYLSKINLEGQRVLDVGVQDKPASSFTQGKAREYVTMDVDPQWNPTVVADLNDDFRGRAKEDDLVNELGRFDSVFCLETLEHVFNPVQAIKNLIDLTEKGGKIYLSTPFINPIHDTHDYLRFTSEWFEKIAQEFSLSGIVVRPRSATVGLHHLQSFFQAEGLRMSKIRLANGESDKLRHIGYFVEMTK